MKDLFNMLKRFIIAPVFEGDRDKTQAAKLLYQIITVIWVLPILLLSIGILGGRTEVIPPAIVLSMSLLTLMVLSRMGWARLTSTLLTTMIVLLIGYADFQNAGNIEPSTLMFAVAIIMSGLLLGRRAPLVTASLILAAHATIVYFQMQGLIELRSAPAVGFENIVITSIMILVIGSLFQFVITRLQAALDEARKNERELQNSNRELQQLSISLEQRVGERTKLLETSAEVSRRLTAILDPVQLSGEVVNQVKTAFDYYHAQIFLFDESGENLVTVAGTGEAGAEMVRRGHTLAKGRGLVARAAETNQPVLVADTSQDPDWLPNQLLPETRAEAAIPIAIGDNVLGVLDVQDAVTNEINSSDITLLQSLASQVAIALQNARQYTETQALLHELSETQSFLDSVIENLPTMLFVKNASDLRFVRWNKAAEELSGFKREDLIGKNDYDFFPKEEADFFTGNDRQVLANRQLLDIPEEPLATAHQGVRYLHTRKVPIYGADGIAKYLLGVSEDITEHKRNEELTQRRAQQQEAINLITQRIQSATTVESALQIATRELGHALGQKPTLVALNAESLATGTKKK